MRYGLVCMNRSAGLDFGTSVPLPRRCASVALGCVMRPFLKWAGGKTRIVERIKDILPTGKRLIEPFVGSGALFLNAEFPHYLLADANTDLIHCYQHLQHRGVEFVERCAAYFTPANNSADAYYELRERFNATVHPPERAALFVYLNRHGYNGLCRYNSSGGFNVPFGRYAKPYFPREEMLSFWRKTARCTFQAADFLHTMDSAELGDVIYCDPPYVPLSSTANFTSYSADGFTLQSQQALAAKAAELARRGVSVILSNHDTAFTRSIYEGANRLIGFEVQRHISCDGANRSQAAELLAVFQAR